MCVWGGATRDDSVLIPCEGLSWIIVLRSSTHATRHRGSWRAVVHSRVMQRVFWWAFKRLFGLHVRNIELVPPPSPYILAANHGSHYDLFLGLAACYEVARALPVPAVWDGVFDLPIIGGIVKAIPFVAIDTRMENDTRRMAARSRVDPTPVRGALRRDCLRRQTP